jgi:hypothetical protein
MRARVDALGERARDDRRHRRARHHLQQADAPVARGALGLARAAGVRGERVRLAARSVRAATHARRVDERLQGDRVEQREPLIAR